MKPRGKIFGVGVGPGDPQLLTIKAVRILKTIPVVAFPYVKAKNYSLAYEIAKEFINPEARLIKLPFVMTRDDAIRQKQRREAADRIREYLLEGIDVAFLSEGDVMLFSTFSYILENLKGEFPVEIIPGISSVMASAADSGLPLVLNDQKLAVLPAALQNIAELKNLINTFDTVVLMKVHLCLEEVKLVLDEMSMLDQTIVVERASSKDSKVFTDISQIRNGELSYMSQVIISRNKRGFVE